MAVATETKKSRPVVTGKGAGGASPRYDLGRAAAAALWAAAIIYLAGTILDLGILWIGQRQDAIQWEFVALSRTVEATPRFAMAFAFAFGAVYVGGAGSAFLGRVLAVGLALVGVAGAGFAALAIMEWLALRDAINPEAVQAFGSTTLKNVVLGCLYLFVMVPAGIIAFRAYRSRG